MLPQAMLKPLEPFLEKSTILIFGVYLALIQFTTSYPYNHLLPVPTPAVLTLGMFSLFLLNLFVYRARDIDYRYEADRNLKWFVYAFAISIVLSIASAFYTLNIIYSNEYYVSVKNSVLTRVLYYVAFVGMTYFGYRMLSKLRKETTLKIISVYPFSILLLVIVGVWQLLYFLFNIPFLDIETRSYLHSVSGTTFFNFRLTSFADEPSYLGPIIIDMMILGFLVFKRKWLYVALMLIPGLAVLFFSFSVSAYLNIVLLIGFIVVFLLFHPKVPKKYLWYALIAAFVGLIAAIILKPDLIAKLLSPILGRLDTLFNPQSSSRIYMYVMPIYWLFDHSLVSALFGYGPGTFDFLANTKILPNGGNLSTSSNNMYIDLLFEHGVVGFALIVFAIIKLGFFLLKKARYNIYYFIGLLQLIHLLITSLYRADFVTPRFWALFLIIFLLVRIGEEREKAMAKHNGVNNLEK